MLNEVRKGTDTVLEQWEHAYRILLNFKLLVVISTGERAWRLRFEHLEVFAQSATEESGLAVTDQGSSFPL